LLATPQTMLTCQDVANKLAIIRYNGIWKTTQQSQRTFARSTCCRLVMDLLRGSYGETGVMEFDLMHTLSIPSLAKFRKVAQNQEIGFAVGQKTFFSGFEELWC